MTRVVGPRVAVLGRLPRTERFYVWVPIHNTVSKNISISDDVYERLKREKGDRSFSELIEDTLETRNRLTEVHGTGILDVETYEAVKYDIEGLSEGTTRRLDDETL